MERGGGFSWTICLLELSTFLFLTGLDSEGIYRISGFADDVEALKNSFDKGKTPVCKID